MIVFVLYYPGNKTIINIGMLFKVFIKILNRNLFFTIYIFANLRNAKTAFVKHPLFAFFLSNYSIYKSLLKVF